MLNPATFTPIAVNIGDVIPFIEGDRMPGRDRNRKVKDRRWIRVRERVLVLGRIRGGFGKDRRG